MDRCQDAAERSRSHLVATGRGRGRGVDRGRRRGGAGRERGQLGQGGLGVGRLGEAGQGGLGEAGQGGLGEAGQGGLGVGRLGEAGQAVLMLRIVHRYLLGEDPGRRHGAAAEGDQQGHHHGYQGE